VERFPRTHRYPLGGRIADTALDLLEALLAAAYGSRRAIALERAQHRVNTLRFLLRLAKDLRLLAANGYGHASERLEEIGRMVGGWRKTEKG